MKYILTYIKFDAKNKHQSVDSWHDLTRDTLISRVVECLNLFQVNGIVTEPKNKIVEQYLIQQDFDKSEIKHEITRMKNAYDAWVKTVEIFSTGQALAGIIRVDKNTRLEIHAVE